jgi:PAP2 superfamily
MPVVNLGWLPPGAALLMAAVLLCVMIALRADERTRRWGSSAREVALVLVLYAAWQYATALNVAGTSRAREAGLWLANLERSLGWPDEASVQRAVLGHDWLISLANSYYIVLHGPVLVATLVWVLVFRRQDWAFARTTVALLTGACMLIQYWPVAPPRLIPSLGIVDTPTRSGVSVYDAIPGANQFSAMPSIHVAWAAAVALIVIVSARTRWRWLALGYPLATLWVTVVTGNHFTIDGVAAFVLLAVAAGVTIRFPSQRPERVLGQAAAARPAALALAPQVGAD